MTGLTDLIGIGLDYLKKQAEAQEGERKKDLLAKQAAADRWAQEREAQRREAIERSRRKDEQDARLERLSRLMENGGHVIIDSNLWMDPECATALGHFLQAMKDGGWVLEMPGEQFAEIERLKRSDDIDKAHRAREAVRLIEPWTAARVLKIGTGNDRTAVSDIDSFLVRQIGRVLADAKGAYVTLVTGDIGLRARVNSLAPETNPERLTVITRDAFREAWAT